MSCPFCGRCDERPVLSDLLMWSRTERKFLMVLEEKASSLVQRNFASYDYLVERIWDGPDGGPETVINNLRVHRGKINKKLIKAGLSWQIGTIWGEGYILEETNEHARRSA